MRSVFRKINFKTDKHKWNFINYYLDEKKKQFISIDKFYLELLEIGVKLNFFVTTLKKKRT